jgi:hypothetical protein
MALDLSALTNPYGQELAGIERNRALATALMQGGQQQPQGQMISGRYVAPSFAQNLNPLAQTVAGLYGQTQADTKQAQLASTIQQKQADILRGYAEAKTPQEKFALGTSPYAPAALQAATWDKLKTQKLSADETLLEGGIGGYTPTFTAPSALAPDVKAAAQLIGLNKPRDQWTSQELAAVNAKATQIQLDKAQKNIVNIPNFLEKTFGGEVATDQAKKFNSMATVAENAPNTIAQIQNQKKILDSGKFFSGKTANLQQDMALYADALGLGGKDTVTKAANTQSLVTGAADATLNAISTSGLGSGQGFTDKDLRFLQDAKSFRIDMNKENIKRVLDLQEKAVLNTTNRYNQRLKTIPQSTVNSMGMSPVTLPNSDLFNAADQIIGK